MRHGPAVERGAKGIADDERPLTDEGRTRTREAARGIARLEPDIDEIWTSPLPRALETAEILARALDLPAPRRTDLLGPEVPARRLLEALRLAKGRCAAFVGHEPGLGEAVALLVGARKDAFPLKKAGLAVVEITGALRGALRLLAPPALLRAFAGR